MSKNTKVLYSVDLLSKFQGWLFWKLMNAYLKPFIHIWNHSSLGFETINLGMVHCLNIKGSQIRIIFLLSKIVLHLKWSRPR